MKTKTNRLSISKKAYADFSSRLTKTFSCRPDIEENVSLAIRLLDAYLDGDVEGLYYAPEHMKIAFAVLAPEIDRAMERSRRARARTGGRNGNDRNTADQTANTAESASKTEQKIKADNARSEKSCLRTMTAEKGGNSLIAAITDYVRVNLISSIRFPMRFREWLRNGRPGLCQDAFAHCSP